MTSHDPELTPPGPVPTPPVAPAGWQGYGGPRPPRPAPVETASTLGLVALVFGAILALLLFLVGLSGIPVAREIETGVAFEDTALLPLGVYSLASLAMLFVIPVTWILASLWLVRARSAARALGMLPPPSMATPWAFLGWIVPIAFFFVPARVVGDLDKATSPTSSPAVGGWWAAWLVTLISARAASTVLGNAEAGDATAAAVALSAVLMVAAPVSFVLWLRVVRRIAARLDAAVAVA